MIDEARWRRADAVGEPVTLSDGQTWLFRRPLITFRPIVEHGKVAFDTTGSFDPLIEAYIDAEPGTPDELNALLNLAVEMLRPNYDLTTEELVRPLVWRNDPEIKDMWRAISDVALGVAPKASAVGSESPSSPTA